MYKFKKEIERLIEKYSREHNWGKAMYLVKVIHAHRYRLEPYYIDERKI